MSITDHSSEEESTGQHHMADTSPSPLKAGSLPDETALLGKRSALVFDSQLVVFIVAAAFLTSFAQPGMIGGIGIKYLILKHMHLHAPDYAKFGFVASVAWYFKPIAGLIMDAFPFLGTRRKSYMVVASFLSTIFWVVLGYSSATYSGLVLTAVVLNVFLMIASTGMGALLVEYGQNKAATGGLSAARETISNIGGILVGVVSGWLATKPFPITGFSGAGLMIVLLLCAIFLLKEKPTAQTDMSVWSTAGNQLKAIFTSKQLWSAALMMLLIFLAPGFTSLLSDIQVNKLGFTPKEMGLLGSISAFTAVIGGVSYGFICRWVDLRKLLVGGIILNVLSSLFYLFYHSYHIALIIDPANGFVATLAILPVFDLAARATPKGCEGMGFALMMAVRNVAMFGSDWAGSQFATSHNIPFNTMVWANAIFTALVLILVPFIPGVLVKHKDGEAATA